MGLTRRENIIIRFAFLHNAPHSLNIVACMAPIALSIQIPKTKRLLFTQLNSCDCTANFSGNESLAADRAFMIEQYSVRSMKAVGLSVVYRDPIGIQFCRRIRRARIEGCSLTLRGF